MNKRAHDRYCVWFPVTLEVGGAQVWAVCHDASSGGVLVLCSSGLQVDDRVTMKFRVAPDDPEERSVKARVVRVHPTEDLPRSVWSHKIAIEFDYPVPELEGILIRESQRPPAM